MHIEYSCSVLILWALSSYSWLLEDKSCNAKHRVLHMEELRRHLLMLFEYGHFWVAWVTFSVPWQWPCLRVLPTCIWTQVPTFWIGWQRGTFRMLAGAAAIWTSGQGCRTNFQDGSSTWLLAGGFSFLSYEVLHRLCEYTHNMAITSPRLSNPSEKRQWPQVFYDLALEVIDHHFCHSLWVPQTSPDSLWEARTIEGCEYLEAGLMGGHRCTIPTHLGCVSVQVTYSEPLFPHL